MSVWFLILSVLASNSQLQQRALKIDQKLISAGYSGVALLTCNGKTYLDKAYGPQANLLKNRYFDIGSITKQMTAAVIVKLVQNKRLKFTDPLEKFITGLPKRAKKITIEQLLTHRSGFDFTVYTPGPNDPVGPIDQDDLVDSKYEEYLRRYHHVVANMDEESRQMYIWNRMEIDEGPKPDDIFSQAKLLREDIGNMTVLKPTTYSYLNLNYNLLAHIIERVTGESYNAYIKKTIFDRHGINCGFNDYQSINPAQAAMGHIGGQPIRRAGEFPEHIIHRGAMGINCRAQDLRKWYEKMPEVFADKAYLNRFRYLEGSTMPKQAYAYGLYYIDGNLIGHSGFVGGFTSDSLHDPKKNCTSISLSNQSPDRSGPKVSAVYSWFGLPNPEADPDPVGPVVSSNSGGEI